MKEQAQHYEAVMLCGTRYDLRASEKFPDFIEIVGLVKFYEFDQIVLSGVPGQAL